MGVYVVSSPDAASRLEGAESVVDSQPQKAHPCARSRGVRGEPPRGRDVARVRHADDGVRAPGSLAGRLRGVELDPSLVNGVPGALAALEQAASGWTESGAGPRLSVALADTSSLPAVDGRNVVYWSPTGYPGMGAALAVTLVSFDETTGKIPTPTSSSMAGTTSQSSRRPRCRAAARLPSRATRSRSRRTSRREAKGTSWGSRTSARRRLLSTSSTSSPTRRGTRSASATRLRTRPT